jgi:hypothetical protein
MKIRMHFIYLFGKINRIKIDPKRSPIELGFTMIIIPQPNRYNLKMDSLFPPKFLFSSKKFREMFSEVFSSVNATVLSLYLFH